MRVLLTLMLGWGLLGIASAFADTTDQKWMNKVEVTKTGDHCVDDKNCFNRYHPAIPAVANANVGDLIVLHTRDALDSEFTLNSIPDDLATVDLGLVHPMTGPVSINGAKRGDAIEVEIVDITPDEYGYTVIAPGFGFLRDIFTEPYIVNWRLTRVGATSPEMPGITVPYEAFPGSIGVMLGKTLEEMGFNGGLYKRQNIVAIKAPVFSMSKLTGVDWYLGPEMKSTGEVMGVDHHFQAALAKALVAADRQQMNGLFYVRSLVPVVVSPPAIFVVLKKRHGFW